MLVEFISRLRETNGKIQKCVYIYTRIYKSFTREIKRPVIKQAFSFELPEQKINLETVWNEEQRNSNCAASLVKMTLNIEFLN